MKISIFNSFKIFTQNLDPDKDQIWHCLIMTPIYLYIVTLFIFLSSLIIHKDFSFEILLNTPVGLLFIAAIYYILVFIPAYFLQLFLLKFNFLNFVSILVSAIFLTFFNSKYFSNFIYGPMANPSNRNHMYGQFIFSNFRYHLLDFTTQNFKKSS